MSDYELELVKRITNIKEKALLDLCEVLIVTQAEQGATVLTHQESLHVRACPVRAHDTIVQYCVPVFCTQYCTIWIGSTLCNSDAR